MASGFQLEPQRVEAAHPAVTLFPDPAQVFADPVDQHAAHLHAFATINLGLLTGSLSGMVHVVCPIEPVDGYVGDQTPAHHSAFLGPNWLTFDVSNDRYRLKGDFQFFFLGNGEELPEGYPGHRNDLLAHREKVQSSFEATRFLATKGWSGATPFEAVGGSPVRANWSSHPPPTSAFRVTEHADTGTAAVANADGRDLTFIASIEGWRFRYMAPTILVFFDPELQQAVLTFDW